MNSARRFSMRRVGWVPSQLAPMARTDYGCKQFTSIENLLSAGAVGNISNTGLAKS